MAEAFHASGDGCNAAGKARALLSDSYIRLPSTAVKFSYRKNTGLSLYEHVPHPHREQRKEAGPPRVVDQHSGFNGQIALRLTAAVGTMEAAYIFTFLALLALPEVLGYSWLPSRTLLIVGWISQTLIQLVMLAVLQLGQNISASAADKRAESTYLDAESILHECTQLQAHLAAQDDRLLAQDAALADLISLAKSVLQNRAPQNGEPT